MNLEIRILDMPETKDIELRSEKVRNIVGKIPPAIDRYGISIIGFLLFVMIGVSMIVPYKETINLTIGFFPDVSCNRGIALVDSQQVSSLEIGMILSFDLCGEKEEAIIESISAQRINGKHQVEVVLLNDDKITIPMKVEGTITILDNSWYHKIVGKDTVPKSVSRRS